MVLTGSTHWKEEFHIHDENDRTFCFSCGWGVEPPVAYIPSEADWQRCTPVWLHDRRDEVVEVMKRHQHVVEEWAYPEYRDG